MNFTKIRIWLAGLLVLLLVGCGGGGGSGTPVLGGNGSGTPVLGTVSTPAATGLVLTLSANSVANNGTQTVVATVIALDGNNNALAGVPVTLAADTGVVTPGGTVTSALGIVTATIAIGSNQTNRTITVTATSGSITKTAPLQVVDSAGGSGTTPSALLLGLSAPTIAADGSQTVRATVTALDIKRNVLPGVVVSFAVDQGATIAPNATSTDSSGVVWATIGIGSSQLNQTITVTTAVAGLPPTTTSLKVVSAAANAQPVAADMSLALSSSTIDNSGAASVVVTATAVDGNRNALAGIPVTFSVDGNAVVTPAGTATNSNGIVTASVTIGADYTNRIINVTATSGTLTRSKPISVIGAKLTASLSPVANAGSTGNVVLYKLVDTNARPMAYQAISVTANGLPTASGATDVNGTYSFTYTAPGAATSLSIQASSAGSSLTSAVAVVIQGGVPNATVVPISSSLSPSPSVVSVNTVGSSTNQVQLRALFVGPNNQPVPNIRVRFDLAGNQNSSDGVVSYAGSFAYSDASGVASGTFTPGQISSPTNGVTVRACWDLVDFATGACPNAVTTTLTVASEALSVSIRTDNTVGAGAANLTYTKQFVVMVVDAAGQAKGGVQITPSIDLPSYYKGFYVWNGTVWAQQRTLANTESYQYNNAISAWQQQGVTTQPSCPNEDVNRNGVREAPVYDPSQPVPALSARGEDLNWNGQLDPRKADVAVTMVGSSTTDANGLAIVQIEYGKNLASWVDFVVTVTASGVKGTEAQASYAGLLYGVGNLPYPAKDVTTQTIAPAFVVSPYGRSTTCQDAN